MPDMHASGRSRTSSRRSRGGAPYRPQLRLQPYVTFFYFVEASGPLTDFLYPEWGDVRFAIDGDWHVAMPGFDNPAPANGVLFGPRGPTGMARSSPAAARPSASALPSIGWHRLIGRDAGRMANRVAPIGDRLGIAGDRLRRELQDDASDADSIARFEALVTGLLGRRPPVSALVLAADQALRTRPATTLDFATPRAFRNARCTASASMPLVFRPSG